MVEDGTISAEQAAGLMEAMEKTAPPEVTEDDAYKYGGQPSVIENNSVYENKMLRVIVDSPQGDKVNVQLPVKIIRQVLKVTGKLPIKSEELQGVDLEALTGTILECLDNETMGNIVEVEDSDGTVVKVFIA